MKNIITKHNHMQMKTGIGDATVSVPARVGMIPADPLRKPEMMATCWSFLD